MCNARFCARGLRREFWLNAAQHAADVIGDAVRAHWAMAAYVAAALAVGVWTIAMVITRVRW